MVMVYISLSLIYAEKVIVSHKLLFLENSSKSQNGLET